VQAAEATERLDGILNGCAGLPRVAVAVSGGSDSMALLRMVADWRGQQGGPREVVALTVDHGLRVESKTEALEVSRWCAQLGVPHYVLDWQDEKPATGLQAKARAARYDLMAQWCRDNDFPVLMTGHTADDQAETVVMRQSRTDSDRSLAGIWPQNEWQGIKLLRPLLQKRREALRNYLRGLRQDWIDDPSNENDNFERVRVRQTMNGHDVQRLNAVASSAQERVAALDGLVRDWLRLNLSVDDYAVVRLPRHMLLHEPTDLQCEVLAWAIGAAGGGNRPERAQVSAVRDWVFQGRESRRSVNGAIVSARRHVVEVMREPGRLRERPVVVPETGTLVFDGRFEVVAPAGAQVGPVGLRPQLRRPKEVPALAFSALPMVRLADGQCLCAVKAGRRDISATVCERFRP
jgi:tRNA(Ile)-lysidine synthase